MSDRNQQSVWQILSNIIHWVMTFTAFVTGIVGFIRFWQEDFGLVTSVLIAVCIGALMGLCLWVRFHKIPSKLDPSVKVAAFSPKAQRWAEVGLFALIAFILGVLVALMGLVERKGPPSPPAPEPPDISLASLSYQVNGGTLRVIDLRSAETPGIPVTSGDRLSLTDLWYAADKDGGIDFHINAEVYVGTTKIGGAKGVPVERGVHIIGDVIPSNFISGTDPRAWQVPPAGWSKLTVVLVLYQAGQVVEREWLRIALSEDGAPGLVPVVPSVSLAALSWAINDGPIQLLDLRNFDNAGIAVSPGDKLTLLEVWYRADRSGTDEGMINIEGYLIKGEETDFHSGFVTKGMLVDRGRHPVSDFSGHEWTVGGDATKLSVRLVQASRVVDYLDIPLSSDGGSELIPLDRAVVLPLDMLTYYDFESDSDLEGWEEVVQRSAKHAFHGRHSLQAIMAVSTVPTTTVFLSWRQEISADVIVGQVYWPEQEGVKVVWAQACILGGGYPCANIPTQHNDWNAFAFNLSDLELGEDGKQTAEVELPGLYFQGWLRGTEGIDVTSLPVYIDAIEIYHDSGE
jgi:hypothetical protein